MRKHLFPGLADAYDAWREHGNTEPLGLVAEAGREHWLQLAREMLSQHRAGACGADCAGALRALAEARPL
jgi:hypothetical protein